MSKAKPTRRWCQFSLRSLLLVTLVICAWLGRHCHNARRQQDSVAAIARLGGWVYYDYQLANGRIDPKAESWVPGSLRSALGVDFFHSVVEMNMVYSREGDRADASQRRSDEAISHLKGLPHLEGLYLCDIQVTDEGLKEVGRLRRLERLYMWDARRVSDAGIAHLKNLKTLRQVHCSDSRIGDESLRVLGRLPRLEKLSLQGNNLTDEGLAHLKGLSQLKRLTVGLGKTKITDAGLAHLANLKNLQQLGLQRTDVTSDGLKHLEGLENLTEIWLGGTQVTDISSLKQALPNCSIQHR
jgi:hypothetical protein